MASAKLRFDLIANTKGFTGKLNAAGKQTQAFGRKMQGMGRSMMSSFTLPLALAGGAAIKMAMDFDRSMTMIKTLVGRTDAEVAKMSVSVKQMSKDFAISSKEAADALYFITSAGLGTEDAIDTLRVSMKAAALGLGETKTIASLTTAAMAAYGKENLSTANATDVLMAAVKEGRLDASQLADSMELVIDSANVMGVEFHELGAAFAAVSRTNKNASVAATGLRQVLMQVLKPSEQAKEQLQALGLSAAGVKQSIADDGLLNTLTMLTDKFKGNDEAVTKVFGSVRALQPVLSLTGANAEQVRGIFERMKNTSGAVDGAFTKLQQSADFRLRKSLNALREDFVSLGANLLGVIGPAISKVAGFVSKLFAKFQGLDGSTKKFIIAGAAIAAALPIIITLVGGLIKVFGLLITPVGLIAAALIGIAIIIYKNWAQIKTKLVEIANYFIVLYNESMGFRIIVESIKMAFKTAFGYAKMQISNTITAIMTIGRFIKDIFGSAGKIIKAAFTLNMGDLKAGISELGTNLGKSFDKGLGEVDDNINTFIDDTKKNIQNGLKNVINPTEVSLVDESIFNGLEDGAMNAMSKVNSFFGSAGTGGGGGGDDAAADTGGGGGGGSIVPNTDGDVIQVNKLAQAMEQMGFTAQSARESVMSSFSQLSGGIVESMGLAGTALGNYVNQVLNMVQEHLVGNMTILMSDEEKAVHKETTAAREVAAENVVTATKTAGVATAVTSNITKQVSDTTSAATSLSAATGEATGDAVVSAGKSAKSFGPAAAFVLPALIAAAVSVVMKSMKKAKKFKEGGIVSGTTLGMVGEYAGARSNPEVIAPLDKLKGMLPSSGATSVNVGGEFVVNGQDLVLALGRANENGERL
jgi:TP901 family phage tail tape measure protein